MALARTRRVTTVDYWPGFVDALSTLILGIIFLLSVFVIVQFFLSQEMTGKDTALTRLNAQIAQLTELLSLERTGKVTAEEQLIQMRANLSATEGERDRYKGLYEGLGSGAATAQGKVTELAAALDAEKRIVARTLAQVEVLNQQIAALRRQLAAVEEALDVSEKKEKESQTRIADLGARLNVALAQRVQELSRYRSEFFGRLRKILSQRSDILVVGDRFVFQSEVLFSKGSADLNPAGEEEMGKLASALKSLEGEIPTDIAWVLRVDGHTDADPIQSSAFRSNWELSAARAIAVVKFLVAQGVSPRHLVAAGFGEFQPIEIGESEDSKTRNRRIELKLTER
jgi:chemotaxis protein MotB